VKVELHFNKLPQVLFVVFCTFLLLSCGKKQEERPIVPTMKFAVDTALLGERVRSENLGLSFSVPKNWKPLESSLEKELQEKMAQQDSTNIRVMTKYVFKNVHGNSVVAVSTILFPQKNQTYQQNLDLYASRIQSGVDSNSIQKAVFLKGDIPITQFVVRSPQGVMFKLLFPSKNHFIQCDYILPSSEFTNEIRAVESSIGSFLLF
jgi:hypothetical protein